MNEEKGEHVSLFLFMKKTFENSKCAPADGAGNVYGGFEGVFIPDRLGDGVTRGPNSLIRTGLVSL